MSISLEYIGRELTIYVGIFLIITGVIGNGINILVFSTVRTYRQSPSAFYFLVTSINNIIYILVNLISRIFIAGYDIDLTRTSNAWCKIRQFSLFTLALVIFTCSCLATIDQFFITSQKASLRRLSNIKWAHRIVLIIIIIWCLHGIVPLVFFTILPIINVCATTNAGFIIYARVYLLGLVSSIPIVVMVVFGYLIYRNIRQTEVLARQSADRQLASMVLIQVVLIVVCIAPYGINSAYGLITTGVTKDSNRVSDEAFASTIFSLLPYCYYSGSCYIFMISSNRFRRSMKERVLFWRKPTQINPTQQYTLKRQTVTRRLDN